MGLDDKRISDLKLAQDKYQEILHFSQRQI